MYLGTAISEENHFNQIKVQYTINSSNIGYDMSDQPMLCIAKCPVSCRVVSCRAVSCHAMSCLDSATKVFSYLKQILLLSAYEIHDYTSLSNAWQNSRHIIEYRISDLHIIFGTGDYFDSSCRTVICWYSYALRYWQRYDLIQWLQWRHA